MNKQEKSQESSTTRRQFLKQTSGTLAGAALASTIASLCDLTILSGDDSLTLPIASVGGKGVISVVANIVPSDVKAMTDLILQGDFVSARKWHEKLFELSKNLLTLSTTLPYSIQSATQFLGHDGVVQFQFLVLEILSVSQRFRSIHMVWSLV